MSITIVAKMSDSLPFPLLALFFFAVLDTALGFQCCCTGTKVVLCGAVRLDGTVSSGGIAVVGRQVFKHSFQNVRSLE